MERDCAGDESGERERECDYICGMFFYQAEDGIRDNERWLEFRRVLFRATTIRADLDSEYIILTAIDSLPKSGRNQDLFAITTFPEPVEKK